MDTQLKNRIADAMRYFIGEGWSIAQAAGIVANLQAESLVVPTQAQHGGGPGYGLAQWERPRQADFRRWAGHDIHESTFTEQLAFVQHELKGTQLHAGMALSKATTANEAGQIVCRLYERPADTERQAVYRGGLADKIAASSADFSNVESGVNSTAKVIE